VGHGARFAVSAVTYFPLFYVHVFSLYWLSRFVLLVHFSITMVVVVLSLVYQNKVESKSQMMTEPGFYLVRFLVVFIAFCFSCRISWL